MADNVQPAANPQPTQPVAAQSSGTCIWAILGLIFAFVANILGLIFSIIALQKIKKDPNLGGHGLALAGLIISIISIVGMVLLFFLGGLAFLGVLSPSSLPPSMT